MLPWRDHSKPNKVLVIALALVAAYVFLIDRENNNAALLMTALFAAMFVYHFVDYARARRRYDKSLDHAAQQQPELSASPEFGPSSEIPDGDHFKVYDIETGDELGPLTGEQLRELVRFHEACGMETNDFIVLAETPTLVQDFSKSDALFDILVDWLNDRDSMQIRWIRHEE